MKYIITAKDEYVRNHQIYIESDASESEEKQAWNGFTRPLFRCQMFLCEKDIATAISVVSKQFGVPEFVLTAKPCDPPEKRYVLIRCCEEDIWTKVFEDLDAARKELKHQYDEYRPESFSSEDWEDWSFCNNDDALLYSNGEYVVTWKISEVS